MKYVLFSISILFYIAFTMSCGASSIDAKQALTMINDNSHQVIDARKNHDSIDITQVLSSLKMVTLKPKDSLYLTGANRVVKVGDKFLLCDYTLGLLLLFDSSGNEIAKIGDIGSGAGQYPAIKEFTVDRDKNEIIVYSNQRRKLVRFTMDGSFIEEQTLSFFGDDLAILDSAKLLFFLNQNTNEVSGENNLLLTDNKGNVLQKAFPITLLPHMGFAYTGFISQTDDAVLFAEAFSDSVYEISGNQCRLKYAVSFGDKTFPHALKGDSLYLSNMDRSYNYVQSEVFETGNYLYVRYEEDKRLRHLVFNKATSKVIKPHLVENGLGEFLFYLTVGGNDGEFCSLFNYDMLKAVNRRQPKLLDELKQYNSDLHDQIINLSPNSNPVLFFFNFNF
jgi:hypothetical protein